MPMRDWKEESKNPAVVAAMQELCLSSFKFFCLAVFEFVYRKKFIWEEPHEEISRALLEVWTGKQKNLVINVAPRYGKTQLLVLFVAWTYAHNPLCEYLHLSYSDELADKNSDQIRTLIKSKFFNDLFKVEIDSGNDKKGEWATTEGGIFRAAATGGQVTGFGAGATVEFDEQNRYVFSGCVWIDDPLKPADAHTTRRDQVNAHWEETIKSRRNSPETTPTICVMQRIHEGDFTAKLLSDGAENFKLLKLKTLKDDGTALWPRKHPVEVLLKMKEANEYVFSAQYQQSPAPAGGSTFKEEWWGWYTELPEFDRVIITMDTASKTEEQHDYSVLQAWGFWKQHGRIYLIDQVRGKWEAPDLKRVGVNFIQSIRSRFRLEAVYVEDKSSGTYLIQTMCADTTAALIPIPRDSRTRGKASRATDTAPHIQARQVFLPEGRDFSDTFVKEASSFTRAMTHLHDDQIDPMMDAVEILLESANDNISMWDVL